MTAKSPILYENDSYFVVITPDALGENGEYGREGYAVVNKETNVVEHTTTVYPQALFQADAFHGALGQMSEAQDDASIIAEAPSDIIPN